MNLRQILFIIRSSRLLRVQLLCQDCPERVAVLLCLFPVEVDCLIHSQSPVSVPGDVAEVHPASTRSFWGVQHSPTQPCLLGVVNSLFDSVTSSCWSMHQFVELHTRQPSSDGVGDGAGTSGGRAADVGEWTGNVAAPEVVFAAIGSEQQVSRVGTAGEIALATQQDIVGVGPPQPRDHSVFELVGEQMRRHGSTAGRPGQTRSPERTMPGRGLPETRSVQRSTPCSLPMPRHHKNNASRPAASVSR